MRFLSGEVAIDGKHREPFNSTPWGSIRFRLAPRAYAPWGCIVRVVSQTKSRKIPTRNIYYRSFS